MPEWLLSSGEVVVDRFRSHLHPGVTSILPEALARIESRGRQFLVEEVDFGHLVGESACVGTGPDDTIVFAQRPRRQGLTRFVKNRAPEPCTSVVVILKKDVDTELRLDWDRARYVLITAFVGHRPEPEPWDRNATPNSAMFWSSHALVWGSEPVVPGTETTECPW